MTSGAQPWVMDHTYHRHSAFPRPQAMAGYEVADTGYGSAWQARAPQVCREPTPRAAEADAYGADAYYGAPVPRLPAALPQATSHRRDPTPPRPHRVPAYGGEDRGRAAEALTAARYPAQTQPRQQSRPQPDSSFYLLDPTARAPSAAVVPAAAPAASSFVAAGYGEWGGVGRPAESRPRSRPRVQEAAERPSAAPAPSPAAPSAAPCCDRCDGPHETDRCPHFRGQRDEHPDAWAAYNVAPAGRRKSHNLRECVAPRRLQRAEARIVAMPGDGSCLFHSLAHGLRSVGYRESGHDVRLRIARFILDHGAQCEISGTPLSSWVEWESRSSVSDYVARLSNEGLWGGAIEMAAAAQIYSVDVAVYEEDGYAGSLCRISDFLSREAPRAAVLVLYTGRSHYDAIDVAAQAARYADYGNPQYGQLPQQQYSAGADTASAYVAQYGAQRPAYGGQPYGAQPYASRPEEDEEGWDCAVM